MHQTSKPPGWEYKTVVFSKSRGSFGFSTLKITEFADQIQERLNEQGAERWELVSMLPNDHFSVLREVTASLYRPTPRGA